MCMSKAKKHIDEKTAEIRKGITAQAFENLEQVLEKLEIFKRDYDGPNYPGFEILLSETICLLLQKASNYLSMSQSQNSKFEETRL